MEKLGTAKFRGQSGKEYDFDVYPMGHQFTRSAAVYAVTHRFPFEGEDCHKIIYIGETGDLSTRFEDHHKRDCFVQRYANCICIHLDDDAESRLTKEDDLVREQSPLCQG
jgi:hypothetical protein